MKETKKARRTYHLLCLLSFLFCFGPLIGYSAAVLFSAEGLLVEKVALAGSIFMVMIMTVIAIINKTVLRSRIFIILIALYLSLDSIVLPLFLVGMGQILDEMMITPMKVNAKTRLIANKTLDKRLL